MSSTQDIVDHISKHLEVRHKYSAARRIFNSLLGVWKCDQTQSFVFQIYQKSPLSFLIGPNLTCVIVELRVFFAVQHLNNDCVLLLY